MARIALALAMIPVVVFTIASAGRTTPPAPIVQHPVVTEGIREQRMDENTFRRRWEPVGSMPPMTEARYVPNGDVVSTVPGAATPDPPVKPSRHRLVSKPARLDVCARHKMHKKYYTRASGWKYWRCRR